MTNQYQAQDIEVLSGLEPVQRRPGMYTDTTHPNHLIQEVVDNSVDEALGGH
jgi:topoisomerase IV subunit B